MFADCSYCRVRAGACFRCRNRLGWRPSPQAAKADLTVSAAISLKDALDEAKQIYTAENPNVAIAVNYGASGTLQLQIEQGAPVDVFLSAAPKQMDALDDEGSFARRNAEGSSAK